MLLVDYLIEEGRQLRVAAMKCISRYRWCSCSPGCVRLINTWHIQARDQISDFICLLQKLLVTWAQTVMTSTRPTLRSRLNRKSLVEFQILIRSWNRALGQLFVMRFADFLSLGQLRFYLLRLNSNFLNLQFRLARYDSCHSPRLTLF